MQLSSPKTKNNENVAVCPCERFGTMEVVEEALASPEQTQVLIQWLSGRFAEECGNQHRSFSCGTYCKKRAGTVLAILNAIRDATRPFLGTPSSETTTPSIGDAPRETMSYDDSFPSLTTVNQATVPKNLIPVQRKEKSRVHNLNREKPKRRIRPANIPVSSVTPTGPWATGSVVGGNAHIEDPLRKPKDVKLSGVWTSEVPLVTKQQTPTMKDPKIVSATNNNNSDRHIQDSSKMNSVVGETKVPEKMMPQLVELYCSLVTSAMVPSSALELHLLLRLLSIPDTGEVTQQPTPSPFGKIFTKVSHCIMFARNSLSNLSFLLQALGVGFVKRLIVCHPVCVHLPDLVAEFQMWLEKHSIWTDPLIPSQNNTAFLTLPFKESRDSRHNYKSIEEQALYKNREDTRDSFLHNLRAFLNLREQFVNHDQASKALTRIRSSSRLIVDEIVDSNLPWFCEFFCELLLQIGNVPLQETDKDLLRIADEDKLQKLHKRFSSYNASNTTNKSTRALVAEPKQRTQSTSTSPVAAAQTQFPGHQEFFFIFVTAADSYVFSSNLQVTLVQLIRKLGSISSRTDLEKRLMDLKLLSRFLGVLVFCPTWRGTSLSLNHTNRSDDSLGFYDGLKIVEALGLPLFEKILEAAEHGKLTTVVPWVVDMLKMAAWDSTIKHSASYWKIVTMLRKIEVNARKMPTGDLPARELLVQCIESYFDETVGIAQAAALPINSSMKLPEISNENLDGAVLSFSQVLLHSCNHHLEELDQLVAKLTALSSTSHRSPGVSRKLRPSTVRTSTISSPLQLTSDYNAPKRASPVSIDSMIDATKSFESTLEDQFFHQHGQLKEIFDFVVKSSLEKSSSTIDEACGLFVQELSPSSSLHDSEAPTPSSTEISQKFLPLLHSIADDTVRPTILALTPKSTNKVVVETTIKIATNRVIQVGEQLCQRSIARAISNTMSRRRLFDAGATEVQNGKAMKSTGSSVLKLTESLEALKKILDSQGDTFTGFCTIVEQIKETVDLFTSVARSHIIPPETELRPLFRTIIELDNCFTDWLVDSALSSENKEDGWHLVSSYVSLAVEISKWSKHGLCRLGNRLREGDTLRAILALGGTHEDSLARFVEACIERRFVKSSSVLEVLSNMDYGRSQSCTHFDKIRDQLKAKEP